MTSTNDKAGTAQIVVGLDDSPQSVAALRWAADYATRTGVQLRLVHVWALNAPAIYGTTVALRETIVQDARASLTKLVRDTLGSAVLRGGWRLEVVEGQTGPTLVKLAEDAELLVLGTGEHTGVSRLMDGSVSHHCISHARVPVLVMPLAAGSGPKADAARGAELQAAGPSR